MPRPRKTRFCQVYDGDRVFKPRSIPMSALETIRLELGELEAMRLCDLERYEQDEAGRRMGISRGTVYRLLKNGRAKILTAILDSRALLIEKADNDASIPRRRKQQHRKAIGN